MLNFQRTPVYDRNWFNICLRGIASLYERAHLTQNLDAVMKYSEDVHLRAERDQPTLFGLLEEAGLEPVPMKEYPVSGKMLRSVLEEERKLLGFYFTMHPVDLHLALGLIKVMTGSETL